MSADAPLRKAIPLAQSILWSPTATPGTGGGGRGGGRPGNIPFPVFLAQSALAAVREHLATAHHIETHEHYFAEPWQVALVLGSDPDGQPVAGLFRAGADEAWATTVLPFYELLSEESFRPGGKKRSFVAWKNYRAYNPVADR